MTYLGKGKSVGNSFYDFGQWAINGEILTLMGIYELKGENLKFGRMASTHRVCQNGMELEASFMHTLESAVK